jgi:S-adenosylmethionine decarboxylase
LFFLERGKLPGKIFLGVSDQSFKNMKKTKRSKQWAVAKSKKYLGKHLVCDFWGGKMIENSKELEEVLRLAAKKAKSTDLEFVCHKFSPQGITGALILAESHITFHSWPEEKYIAIDIFTCGKKAKPEAALSLLKKILKPEKIKVKEVKRG